ncbi:MAG: hypothetical protein SVO01_00715 [Thermotogota bacterium]|nr:hypothetical protein [Thermotogota bacterium]
MIKNSFKRKRISITTPLQKAAQSRNFAKMRLKGMMATAKDLAYSKDLSSIESDQLLTILHNLKQIEKTWQSEWEEVKKRRGLI